MSSDELNTLTFAGPSEGDSRQRMQFSRQCFHSIETFLEARKARPAGHPDVVDAAGDVQSALQLYFEHAPSLPALVQHDGLYDFQTQHQLWDSSTATDVAESLRDHGIGVVGIRHGVSMKELHQFLDVFARCANEALALDPVLDLEFQRVRFEWLDQSAVQLAGVGADLPAPDPTSVTRATHRLFEREFARRFAGRTPDGPTLLALLDGDLLTDDPPSRAGDSGTPPPIPSDETTGADETPPIQIQRAQMFRSLLDDQPGLAARRNIAENAAAAVVQLLDNNQFNDARRCVQTFRDASSDFCDYLGKQIEAKLDSPRRRRIAEFLALADPEDRKSLLEFAHSLHSKEVTELLGATLKWDIPEPAARDLLRFLERRSDDEFRELLDIIDQLTTERAKELIEAAAEGLPETRSFLKQVLDLDLSPLLKGHVLEALHGHWDNRDRVFDIVAPLIGTPNETLRRRAIEALADAAPERIKQVLDPYVSESLARRSQSDLEAIVQAYAAYGGTEALERLENLIRVKRFANEQRRELAVTLVEALAELDSDPLRTMLGRVADDWLVASDVRKACKSARNRTTS